MQEQGSRQDRREWPRDPLDRWEAALLVDEPWTPEQWDVIAAECETTIGPCWEAWEPAYKGVWEPCGVFARFLPPSLLDLVADIEGRRR